MKLILKADRLIDGSSTKVMPHSAVVIEGDTISKVCSQSELTETELNDARVIDSSNGTLMPGFIEMHSHIHCSAESDAYTHITTETNETFLLRGSQAVRSALSSGVTTMRDLGSKNEVVFPLKQSIEDGIVPGPRLLVAGTPITTTGGHCNTFGTEADSSDQVVTAIRNQFKLGADHIKIMSTGGGFTPGTNVRAPQYDWTTLRDAVKDAERLGLKVAAHCHATEGVKNCVKAGIHNLIHCSWLSENPEELYDYDPDVVDQIAEKGIYVDPTLALSHLNKLRGRVKTPDSGAMADPERRFEILRDMWDRGVKFVTGMDSGMTNAHFDDFAYIPEVMVNSMGISPMEAITCATKTSSECLGKESEIGTITPGKSADLLIINGDPSEKIEALHNVDTIVARGSVVKEAGQLLI
ncbi:MAG: amidohydrolase family protein [Chloroflexota bacterium]|nr:amidohydrolase family protein [Chloroflexota bacterium]